MLTMREIRAVRNDVQWIKTQLEAIKRWMRKHDAYSTNSRTNEPNLESTTRTGEKEEKDIDRHKSPDEKNKR